MSTQKTRAGSILQFLLIFGVVYLGSQATLRYFFPEQYGPESERTGIYMESVDATVKQGHYPEVRIRNYTDVDYILESRCPNPPVEVGILTANGDVQETSADDLALPCEPDSTVPANDEIVVSLAPWKYSLFDSNDTFEILLPRKEGQQIELIDAQTELRDGVEVRYRDRIEMYEAGVFTQLFRTFITKPLLNALIFIAAHTPGYNLGVAIIILTIIVKLILFLPTQHAMEGQRKMQAVQPKMDALKTKYKENPQKLQEETMKLWKEHKVNPMQSCLPMLVQFPVLIGLFFVIRDGSVLSLSREFIYEPYQHLSWTFGMHFLGLDLAEPNIIIMPILLMVMQFLQMKLSFAINSKKQEGKNEKKSKEQVSQQEIQQRVMMYGLPLMIGFFAIQFPAAVSLYWAVSTVFAIVQQVYVNRKELR